MNSVWVRRAVFFVLTFSFGLCVGLLLDRPALHAQNNDFGPENVKSVPESFLRGGDRTVAALEDIKGILQEQTTHLIAIEKNTSASSRAADR